MGVSWTEFRGQTELTLLLLHIEAKADSRSDGPFRGRAFSGTDGVSPNASEAVLTFV